MTRERSAIGIFGAGYVGLVVAGYCAGLGRRVIVHDVDSARVEMLRAGLLPISEPGLMELIERGVSTGCLMFATEPGEAVAGAGIVIIAVGTPLGEDGEVDLRFLEEAAHTIVRHVDGPTLIVNKSTAPVGTAERIEGIVEDAGRHQAIVVCNPEFLRQGSAVADFFRPDRIVIGCRDRRGEHGLRELYASLDAPVIVTDFRTAEMIKYAANAFLATKISFANELRGICERLGIDVNAVVAAVGADRRIGTSFFQAGIGFGGSCLPKDVKALRSIAASSGLRSYLLDAVLEVNRAQVDRVLELIGSVLGTLAGKRIGVLGLAFKVDTDDVRDGQSIALIESLLSAGAEVCVHDPLAMGNARAKLGERVTYAPVSDFLAVAETADAVVIATAWGIYRDLDFGKLAAKMRGRLIVDAVNICDPAAIDRAGLHDVGSGRTS